MATYNGTDYLQAQWLSIVGELKRGDELVVVDDSSGDGTLDLLHHLLDSHASVAQCTIVENRETVGHVRTFLRAMSLASRPLVALSDQDDVWIPGRLDRLAKVLSETDATVAFGSLTAFRGSDEDSNAFVASLQNDDQLLRGFAGLGRFLMSPLLSGRLYAYGSACMYRREKIDLALPIATEAHEHWLLAQALAREGAVFTSEPVTCRRLHEGNLTRRRPTRDRIQARLRTATEMAQIVWRS